MEDERSAAAQLYSVALTHARRQNNNNLAASSNLQHTGGLRVAAKMGQQPGTLPTQLRRWVQIDEQQKTSLSGAHGGARTHRG